MRLSILTLSIYWLPSSFSGKAQHRMPLSQNWWVNPVSWAKFGFWNLRRVLAIIRSTRRDKLRITPLWLLLSAIFPKGLINHRLLCLFLVWRIMVRLWYNYAFEWLLMILGLSEVLDGHYISPGYVIQSFRSIGWLRGIIFGVLQKPSASSSPLIIHSLSSDWLSTDDLAYAFCLLVTNKRTLNHLAKIQKTTNETGIW